METTENEHRKFELNALRYRQSVRFHKQWRYVLVLPFGVDQPSSGVQSRLGRAVNGPIRPPSVALS